MNLKLSNLFAAVIFAGLFFAVSVSAQMKILQTPDERFANLPDYNFKPNYVEVAKGLRMHYVDEGKKDAPVIVLLHGQPSWSYLYRKMIPVLAKENRVIAPDMVGFGRSDKLGAREDYTYARHVEWMTAFFEKMKFKKVTLVVHDWGGLIGLRVLANHPDWFSKLVVLNTSFNIGEDYAGFTDRYKEGLKRWEDYLATAKDIKFAGAVQANVLRQLSPAELAAYDAPFGDDALSQGAREMTFLIPLKPDRPGIAENIAAEKILREWKKPVFIAFSEDSERVHPKQLGRFRDIFARSQMWAEVSVPGSKHFLQEDKGAELAVLINAFAAGKKYSPEMMSVFGAATAAAGDAKTPPPAATASFAGTWVLDKANSESLPEAWQNSKTVNLIITQDDKQITTQIKFVQTALPVNVFLLDGKETKSDVTGRITGKAVSKLKSFKPGKPLKVEVVTTGIIEDREIVLTQTDEMELSADGKTLKVRRTQETPRRTQQFKFTMTKQ